MMYQNGLVAVVKVKGKVLREDSGTVYIPFGSEYSLLVKNLNSKRVMVSVTIDGTNIADGTQFVIDANSSIELERFVRNGNLNSGNKFKFIERTSEIENFRGIEAEDGLIHVESWNELVQPPPIITPQIYPWWGTTYISNGYISGGYDTTKFVSGGTFNTVNCCSTGVSQTVANEAGITVSGAQSNQSFQTVWSFPVESQSHVIVLNLKGKTKNVKVSKPITVKSSKTCKTCGKKSSGIGVDFCSRCGTSLNII